MTPPPTESPAGSAELISGPDLGGGFLHQLTRERSERAALFTFHAQDGGQDAGGPPKGSLDPLGWATSEGMCPIGGRRCWHRRFALTDAETGIVRACYQRTRLVMELSIEQSGGRAQPTWDDSFVEVADRIAAEARSEPLPWALSRAVLDPRTGMPAPVRELELVTTEAGVIRISGALREYLIEPPGPTDWPPRSVLGARAFVGTPRAGARIAWRAAPGLEPTLRAADRIPPPNAPASSIEWAGRIVALTAP